MRADRDSRRVPPNASAQLRANKTIASKASYHSSPVCCSALLDGVVAKSTSNLQKSGSELLGRNFTALLPKQQQNRIDAGGFNFPVGITSRDLLERLARRRDVGRSCSIEESDEGAARLLRRPQCRLDDEVAAREALAERSDYIWPRGREPDSTIRSHRCDRGGGCRPDSRIPHSPLRI